MADHFTVGGQVTVSPEYEFVLDSGSSLEGVKKRKIPDGPVVSLLEIGSNFSRDKVAISSLIKLKLFIEDPAAAGYGAVCGKWNPSWFYAGACLQIGFRQKLNGEGTSLDFGSQFMTGIRLATGENSHFLFGGTLTLSNIVRNGSFINSAITGISIGADFN